MIAVIIVLLLVLVFVGVGAWYVVTNQEPDSPYGESQEGEEQQSAKTTSTNPVTGETSTTTTPVGSTYKWKFWRYAWYNGATNDDTIKTLNTSLKDAKAQCEIDPECNGLSVIGKKDGSINYSLRKSFPAARATAKFNQDYQKRGSAGAYMKYPAGTTKLWIHYPSKKYNTPADKLEEEVIKPSKFNKSVKAMQNLCEDTEGCVGFSRTKVFVGPRTGQVVSSMRKRYPIVYPTKEIAVDDPAYDVKGGSYAMMTGLEPFGA